MSVVVVIAHQTSAASLARWGARFARCLDRQLVVLCVERGAKGTRAQEVSPESLGQTTTAGPLAETVFEALGITEEQTKTEDGEDGTTVQVKVLVQPDLVHGVLRELESTDARLLVLAGRSTENGRPEGSSLSRALFRRAPCDTVLLRLGASDAQSCRRVLVPAAGGPHSARALRLGGKCAVAQGGEMTALYVEPDSDEVSRTVGEHILQETLSRAGFGDDDPVTARVELAREISEGIGRVAEEGFDLVLMGASRVGTIRRKLFQTVPDRLLRQEGGVTVGVVRAAEEPSGKLRSILESWLDLRIPQLERGDRVALVENLQTGSRWSFDFLALMGLSTAIAALGLLQDSAAVVIGAMLVAPLMTPLLGAGLALVQGNLPLVRTASQAIFLGFLSAFVVSFVAGLLVPLPVLTDQLAARGSPTLLDLGVAFFSGMAAAYCVGRPNLSAALPGVAIAAALVPPIGTIGICLALGEISTARGAAILFGTNVVTIVLGAAASFFGAGIRANGRQERGNRWARTGLAALALVVVALAVPLGSFLISQLADPQRPPVKESLQQALEKRVALDGNGRLQSVTVSREQDPVLLDVVVEAARPVSPGLAPALAALAAQEYGEPVKVRITTHLWEESIASPVPASPVPASPVPASPVPAGPVPASPVPAEPSEEPLPTLP